MLARTLAAAAVLSLPLLALTYPYGAPAGVDGYNDNCATCHRTADGDPNVNVGTGAVTITAPEVYVAGEPIEITVAVTNTTEPASGGARLQGFQVAVRDDAGGTLGTFDLGGSAALRFADGDPAYVTHSQQGSQQTSWTFDWLPPADMAPASATIYASGNAANGNNALTGDFVYTAEQPLALVTAGEPGPDERAVRLGAVSPQPVRSTARVRLTLREPGDVSARLVDGRGRTVRTFARGLRPAGESWLEIDARGLGAGVYFLVVDAVQGRRTARVVVAR